MKKIYITPMTEKVRVCGHTDILDNKFDNSHGVTKGDQGGYSGDQQGAKPHYNVWDEEDRVGGNGLWD